MPHVPEFIEAENSLTIMDLNPVYFTLWVASFAENICIVKRCRTLIISALSYTVASSESGQIIRCVFDGEPSIGMLLHQKCIFVGKKCYLTLTFETMTLKMSPVSCGSGNESVSSNYVRAFRTPEIGQKVSRSAYLIIGLYVVSL